MDQLVRTNGYHDEDLDQFSEERAESGMQLYDRSSFSVVVYSSIGFSHEG